jgi:predicted nuclease with TOPRIM domain
MQNCSIKGNGKMSDRICQSPILGHMSAATFGIDNQSQKLKMDHTSETDHLNKLIRILGRFPSDPVVGALRKILAQPNLTDDEIVRRLESEIGPRSGALAHYSHQVAQTVQNSADRGTALQYLWTECERLSRVNETLQRQANQLYQLLELVPSGPFRDILKKVITNVPLDGRDLESLKQDQLTKCTRLCDDIRNFQQEIEMRQKHINEIHWKLEERNRLNCQLRAQIGTQSSQGTMRDQYTSLYQAYTKLERDHQELTRKERALCRDYEAQKDKYNRLKKNHHILAENHRILGTMRAALDKERERLTCQNRKLLKAYQETDIRLKRLTDTLAQRNPVEVQMSKLSALSAGDQIVRDGSASLASFDAELKKSCEQLQGLYQKVNAASKSAQAVGSQRAVVIRQQESKLEATRGKIPPLESRNTQLEKDLRATQDEIHTLSGRFQALDREVVCMREALALVLTAVHRLAKLPKGVGPPGDRLQLPPPPDLQWKQPLPFNIRNLVQKIMDELLEFCCGRDSQNAELAQQVARDRETIAQLKNEANSQRSEIHKEMAKSRTLEERLRSREQAQYQEMKFLREQTLRKQEQVAAMHARDSKALIDSKE